MVIARYILLSRIFTISARMALYGELHTLVSKALLYGTPNAWFWPNVGPTCPHPKRHVDRFISFSTTHGGRELL